MATYVPPTMSGEQVYPDDPAKAQAVEDQRNARVATAPKEEPAPQSQPQPPAGLTPNEILSWSGAITAPPNPAPGDPESLAGKSAKEPPPEEEKLGAKEPAPKEERKTHRGDE
jgi:hypothetical protein